MEVYSKDFSVTDYTSKIPFRLLSRWPTFLNTIAEQRDAEIWKKYIDKENFFYTIQSYTSPENYVYADWILETFPNEVKYILADLAGRGSLVHLERYKNLIEKNGKMRYLDEAIMIDNFAVVEAMVQREKMTFEEVLSKLETAFGSASPRSIDLLVKEIAKFEPRPLTRIIWHYLKKNHNYSLVMALAPFLELTPCTENLANWLTIYTGSIEDVKTVLKKQPTNLFITSAISRIPFEEEMDEVIDEYVRMRFKENYDEIGRAILESPRESKETEAIIESLGENRIIFTQNTTVDLCNITAQAMKAMVCKWWFFNAKMFTVSRSHLWPNVLIEENIDVLKDFVKCFCSEMNLEQKTMFFVAMGTSMTKWGHFKGYISKVSRTKRCLKRALESGNSFALAKILDMCSRKIDMKICRGLIVHGECKALIASLAIGERDQLKQFIEEDFKSTTFDTTKFSPMATVHRMTELSRW